MVHIHTYTPDGHLIGEDHGRPWLMPRNAMEFFDRYASKVRIFCRMHARFGTDPDDIEQLTYVWMFSPTTELSRYQGSDKIIYLNQAFADTDTIPCLGKLLAYIRAVIQKRVIEAKSQGHDALSRWDNLCLDTIDPEEDGTYAYKQVADTRWAHPDRSLELQQFLGYLDDCGRSDLAEYLIAVENSPVYRFLGVKQRTQVLKFADLFEGKPLSGRTHWAITRDYIRSAPRLVHRHARFPAGVRHAILTVLTQADSPAKTIASTLQIPATSVSSVLTKLRRDGYVRRTGERTGKRCAESQIIAITDAGRDYLTHPPAPQKSGRKPKPKVCVLDIHGMATLDGDNSGNRHDDDRPVEPLRGGCVVESLTSL